MQTPFYRSETVAGCVWPMAPVLYAYNRARLRPPGHENGYTRGSRSPSGSSACPVKLLKHEPQNAVAATQRSPPPSTRHAEIRLHRENPLAIGSKTSRAVERLSATSAAIATESPRPSLSTVQ